jgi:SAM-dependent methyltransferase
MNMKAVTDAASLTESGGTAERRSFRSDTAATGADVSALPARLDLPDGEARRSLLAVHTVVLKALPAGELAIYEAGGGSTSFLPTTLLQRAKVTVVDIDAEQLTNNDYANECILGDIQTYRFAPGRFDLITCYNVIEHLPDVEAALRNFIEAVRVNGLIVIGAPNPASLSGIVTRYTPHWFHVWFYRRVLGRANAGLPGEPPFPTFFQPLVAPSRLKAFAFARGMEVLYEKTYESPRFDDIRGRSPLVAALLDGFATLLNVLMLNRTDVRKGDYHMVLRRVSGSSESAA